MRLGLVLMVIAVFAARYTLADTHALTVDLAQKSVDITTGFNGAHLQLFGVQDQPGEIVVMISGPRRDMVVRQKKRVFGVWTNLRGLKFEAVPAYYNFALIEERRDEGLPEFFNAHEIGISALNFKVDGEYEEDKVALFHDALIRNKQAEKLYPREPQVIEFLNDRFFKTSFYIPSNVPIGDYKIQTFLFRDGALSDVKTMNVKVGQVGASAGVHSFSRDNALGYGFLCVMFALFMGWVSNAIRNRA